MSQGVRKGATYVLFGQGIASIFLFFFQIFAGRWLGIEEYGLLNILYSAIFIVAVIAVAGVVQGLIRYIAFFEAKEDSKGVRQSIQTSTIIYLIFLFITILVSLIFKDLLLLKLFNGSQIILIQFLIGLFGLSLFRFYNGIIQGYRKFHIFSFGIGIKEFIMFLLLVVIVKYMHLSVKEAGWSIVISSFIGILFILTTMRNPHLFIKWKGFDRINLQIVRFILMAGLIALMNQWVVRAGPILLKIIGGDKADYHAGLFSAVVMPLNLARTAVVALLTGLFPNLSRAYSLKDENLIRRYTLKSVGIVGALTFFIIPIYYYYGPQIVRLLYGQEYAVLKSDTILLALVISFFLFGMLLSKILMARGTPKYSAFSFLIGILGLLSILFWVKLPPMKLVEISLLVCNFLYTSLQAIYLIFIKFQRSIKKQGL
ncbi:oligosaccharide flippase family protein [candidate division WOR-3 bacterium]|nr:oligosaccharide flippase family protein [candidate division WOR-3 bacterium]